MSQFWPGRRVLVTGGNGFLGRVVVSTLRDLGADVTAPTHDECDLTVPGRAESLFAAEKPSHVIHLAARVGGIGYNQVDPARLYLDNLLMGTYVIEAARATGVEKTVLLGTVCSYPKFTPVPFREESLWDGYPEETNAPYGVAKKAIFVMLDGYRREYGLHSAVAVPVNLYGPGDNFDPASSHVIPALIRKCEEARLANAPEVVCWGTGAATREFLYVDDAAEGIVRAAEVMEEPVPINLGGGLEIPIRDLVVKIAAACGYPGRIAWDPTKPDGQPRRGLDISRARKLLGWEPRQDFDTGLARTVAWWREQTAAGG